jgi:hypothetical protein
MAKHKIISLNEATISIIKKYGLNEREISKLIVPSDGSRIFKNADGSIGIISVNGFGININSFWRPIGKSKSHFTSTIPQMITFIDEEISNTKQYKESGEQSDKNSNKVIDDFTNELINDFENYKKCFEDFDLYLKGRIPYKKSFDENIQAVKRKARITKKSLVNYFERQNKYTRQGGREKACKIISDILMSEYGVDQRAKSIYSSWNALLEK